MKILASNFKNIGVGSLGIFALALSPVHAADSVSHYGVTVHFAEDHPTGQFANGEPYIVLSGAGSVTGIDKPSIPIDSIFTGGAMLNPVPGGLQGFCPRNNNSTNPVRYSAALDVSLICPFNVNTGDSLIVATSIDAPLAGNNYVQSVVVFTFLAETPAAGSFRPSPYGINRKVRFNVSDINWACLKNLPTVPLAFSQAYMENDEHLPALPFWEWHGNWDGSSIRPFQNCAATENGLVGSGARPSNYGRDIAAKWSRVALWLNLDLPQAVKKRTMIHTIQVGLDVAAFLDQGLSFGGSGGHQVGNKFPLVLASAALGAADGSDLVALAAAENRFVEDGCTFFVTQADIDLKHESGGPANYIQSDLGLPDWGIGHWWIPQKDDRRFEAGNPYRFAQWPNMVGQVLAAELMGLKSAWNDDATFAYTDRFLGTMPFNTCFEEQMWDRYKVGRPSTPKGLKLKR